MRERLKDKRQRWKAEQGHRQNRHWADRAIWSQPDGDGDGGPPSQEPPPNVGPTSIRGESLKFAREDHTHGYPVTYVFETNIGWPERPSGWLKVVWVGITEPPEAFPGDIWYDYQGLIYVVDQRHELPNVDPPAIGYVTSTGIGYFRLDDGDEEWVSFTHWEQPA